MKRDTTNWEPTLYIKKQSLIPNEKYIYPSAYYILHQNAKFFESYLPKFLKGSLVDLGCGTVPLYGFFSKYVKKWVCIDWKENGILSNKVIEHDLNKKLPLKDNSFDTILLTEVLEHIENPFSLFKEMRRILKRGGHAIITVPFLYFIHEEPHDFFRYTKYTLLHLAKINKFAVKHLHERGGIFEAIAELFSAFIVRIPLIGPTCCVFYQKMQIKILGLPLINSLSASSKGRFPTGYFLILEKL